MQKLSVLSRCLLAAAMATAPAAGRAQCVTRPMRITFYTCAEGSRDCLTKQGNHPMPFRTVAVGDPRLLGRWLYIEDLGGWVHASDSGSALRPNSVDVFIGDARMAPHARRLGVHHWNVRWCDPAATRLRSSSAARSAAPRRTEASRSHGTRSPGRLSTPRRASRQGSGQPSASAHSSASSRLAEKRRHSRARPRTRAPRSRLETRIARRPTGSAR